MIFWGGVEPLSIIAESCMLQCVTYLSCDLPPIVWSRRRPRRGRVCPGILWFHLPSFDASPSSSGPEPKRKNKNKISSIGRSLMMVCISLKNKHLQNSPPAEYCLWGKPDRWRLHWVWRLRHWSKVSLTYTDLVTKCSMYKTVNKNNSLLHLSARYCAWCYINSQSKVYYDFRTSFVWFEHLKRLIVAATFFTFFVHRLSTAYISNKCSEFRNAFKMTNIVRRQCFEDNEVDLSDTLVCSLFAAYIRQSLQAK